MQDPLGPKRPRVRDLVATVAPLAIVGAGIALLSTASHPVEDLAHLLLNLLLIVAGALLFVLAQVQAQYLTSKRAGPGRAGTTCSSVLGTSWRPSPAPLSEAGPTQITPAGSVRQ